MADIQQTYRMRSVSQTERADAVLLLWRCSPVSQNMQGRSDIMGDKKGGLKLKRETKQLETRRN